MFTIKQGSFNAIAFKDTIILQLQINYCFIIFTWIFIIYMFVKQISLFYTDLICA